MATMFISNLALVISIFFLLRSELAHRDQNIATIRFHEISSAIKLKGIEFLNSTEASSQLENFSDLLVVVFDENNKEIFKKLPSDVKNFDPLTIVKSIDESRSQFGHHTTYAKNIFQETIEIYSGMSSPYLLVVGFNTDASEDLVNLYFKYAVILTLLAGLLSVSLGYLFARKALKPVHQLIATVKLAQAGDLTVISDSEGSKYELSELTGLFNEMILQIKKLILSLQTSLDAIAHDLRTPLTHMSLTLEKILKDPNADLTRETVGELLEETQSISNLVSTLLEITEADSKSLVLKKETFLIKPLLQESIDLYEYISDEKQAKITLTCDPQLSITADRNKLKRVIANLLDNALKYTFKDPEISLGCFVENNKMKIFVKDNGIGIDENDLGKIWQRLYRGDASRTTAGMGLGLSFVKSIVDAHNWKIDARSFIKKGTTFEIEIPL